MRLDSSEEDANSRRSCIRWPLRILRREPRIGRVHSSRLRRNARFEFLQAAKRCSETTFSDPESLPSLEAAYVEFVEMFPRFVDTLQVDEIRSEEYAHLRNRAVFDYAGFGLFSHLQSVVDPPTSSFRLAYVSANLATHALYGTAEEGTMEGQIRRCIMDYFHINESDYSMVFTASKTSAVKLLAESYRFEADGRLLYVYDHHSESIDAMVSCAREKGAKVNRGIFSWPSLKLRSKELAKELKKAKKDGLFVFAPQSRVTGAVYTYQWISLAQRHHWHVLLDASALGPRDMEALGLSVFSPDFIVGSFYKVFGADPTGFGCLFIKKSSIQSLGNSPKARAVGMVRIVPNEQPETGGQAFREVVACASTVSSFSGPLSTEEIIGSRDCSELLQSPRHHHLEVRDGAKGGFTSERETSSDENEADIAQEGAAPAPVSCCDKGKQKVSDEYGEEKAGPSVWTGERTEPSARGEQAGPSTTEERAEPSSTAERAGGKRLPSSTRIWTLAELLAMPDQKLDALIFERQERERACHASVAFTSYKNSRTSSSNRKEGLVVCRAIEQTVLVGVLTSRDRLRCLVNWLVLSLMRLRHPSGSQLVVIYGPSSRYDRGISVAFNICDWTGMLVEPTLVQRLADRKSISLGLGVIKNVQLAGSGGTSFQMVVVTLSLAFITAFEDVYKLWAFVAQFLDADFVKREGWRYQALNQQLVLVS